MSIELSGLQAGWGPEEVFRKTKVHIMEPGM